MVILWDKIPLSNALAMSLQTAQWGGKTPPRCAVFPSIARFLTSGKPAFVFIRNFMVGIGGKYVEALDLCAEKC